MRFLKVTREFLHRIKTNRFDKFLEVSGIVDRSTAERAQYFVWYHTNATKEKDVDVGVIREYLEESGTPTPELYELYSQLADPGLGSEMTAKAPIPGRVRAELWELVEEEQAAKAQCRPLPSAAPSQDSIRSIDGPETPGPS